jgi:hypothetical protein
MNPSDMLGDVGMFSILQFSLLQGFDEDTQGTPIPVKH